MPVSMKKRGVPKQLLVQILEQPGIVSVVQSLEPAVLHRWIEAVGLEDAGELVALASSKQLLAMLDLDVWCSERAGVDETFDPERFALWVEVLLDSGVRGALSKIAELDEDLLTLAIAANTFVIDIEELARRMSSGRYDEDEEGDPDLLLKELDGALCQDFEQFRVIARRARCWEPMRTLLVELDAAEPDLFVRLLERCAHISLEYIADNGGLYEVLSSGEMVDADVAAQREDRRGARGYVAPSAARAFLAHARLESLDDLRSCEKVDPITHAYFRDTASAQPDEALRSPGAALGSPPKPDVRTLIATLQEHAVIPGTSSTSLLSSGTGREGARDLTIVRAVRALSPDQPAAHAARVDELAYLANVVLAGCSTRRGELRDADAARAALAICDRGAATLFAETGPRQRQVRLTSWLADHSLVKLFRIGWHELSTAGARGQSDAELVERLVSKLAADPERRSVSGRLAARRAT